MLVRTEQVKISREEDFPAWVLEQAKVLCHHKPRAIDWEALAEHLEEVYAQVKIDLDSDLRVILQHLLKLEFQPGDNELKRRARGWKVSATEHRNRVSLILRESRSLRKKLPEAMVRAYAGSRKEAALHMSMDERTLPLKCPWTTDEVLDLDFFPERVTATNGRRH